MRGGVDDTKESGRGAKGREGELKRRGANEKERRRRDLESLVGRGGLLPVDSRKTYGSDSVHP